MLLLLIATALPAADPKRDTLGAAVRNGDATAIRVAIAGGADVNARNEYGITAPWVAGGKAETEVVEARVKAGADVNARDDIEYQTSPGTAVSGGQAKTVERLIRAGTEDNDAAVGATGRSGRSSP